MSDREVICAGCVLRQDISDLQQENTALKEKLAKAVECVKLYGDIDNYDTKIDFVDGVTHNFISRDIDHEEIYKRKFIGGKLARQTLKEIGEE